MSLGWDLPSKTNVLISRGYIETDKKTVGRLCTKEEDGHVHDDDKWLEQIFPHIPQKESTLSTG